MGFAHAADFLSAFDNKNTKHKNGESERVLDLEVEGKEERDMYQLEWIPLIMGTLTPNPNP